MDGRAAFHALGAVATDAGVARRSQVLPHLDLIADLYLGHFLMRCMKENQSGGSKEVSLLSHFLLLELFHEYDR